ncbi:hypothetical protein NMY22_g19672 [Coprinellus aureogranulatus]|nr:hypothetical protein NMY22_g19672 [Coprinellus aureogranulatus]
MKVCTLVDEDAVTGKQGDLYIRSVCFSPCGRWLATGAEDKVVRIWDIARQKIAKVFDGHQQEIYALEFSLDGKVLVSGSGDKTARVWDVSILSSSPSPTTENGSSMQVDSGGIRPTVLTIEDSASEKYPELDVGDEDDGDDGEQMDGVEGPGSGNGNQDGGEGEVPSTADPGITSIAVSPDGRYVAAGSLDSVIRLWDLRPPAQSQGPGQAAQQQPRMVERLKGHKDSGMVQSVVVYEGREGSLSAASLDKGVRAWGRVASKHWNASANGVSGRRKTRCVTQFVGHRDFVLSVAVSHDGKWVVSGSKDRGVMWWEVPEPKGDSSKSEGSAEGTSKEKEGGASRKEPEDREAVCVLQGHKNSVISIDLSPVGNLLATGSGDWQARISDAFIRAVDRDVQDGLSPRLL